MSEAEKAQGYVNYSFGTCQGCGKPLPSVDLPLKGHDLWFNGMDIDEACPKVPLEQRRIVKYHLCPECQKKRFGK